MIFLFEAVPEQIVRRYFLQVKKLTFKRAPGSQYALPTQEGAGGRCPKKVRVFGLKTLFFETFYG
jgi:hypothetical protein